MNTKQIHIADYNYPLPDERIAKFPLTRRDQSKLLIYRHGDITEDVFAHITNYLPDDAVMVFNNTKVIQARLHFQKNTGAHIEVFLLEPFAPADYERMFEAKNTCEWLCLVGNMKKWKEGALSCPFTVDGTSVELTCERLVEHGTSQRIRFTWNHPGLTFADIIDMVGELPIPPYLNRKTQESDKTTYQTVYSKIKGSVAAPTAGLHFTNEVLADIDAKGIERAELTLHVGAGTFKPVKSEVIEQHEMHTEFIAVPKQVIDSIIAHQAKVVAVGTTSVRTLESLYYMGAYLYEHPEAEPEMLHVSQWEPYEAHHALSAMEALQTLSDYMERKHWSTLHGSTQIIIAPGYKYKVVKVMVTNFHQPQSTLLLLVSAFVHGDWHSIYDYALSHDFRFLSYGDSSLLIP